MAFEAFELAKDTLTTGAQPTIVRKHLQDKFGTNLMGKNLIKIKQTLQVTRGMGGNGGISTKTQVKWLRYTLKKIGSTFRMSGAVSNVASNLLLETIQQIAFNAFTILAKMFFKIPSVYQKSSENWKASLYRPSKCFFAYWNALLQEPYQKAHN
ncbi:hypothetical protein DAPPUDRAFT_335671 [Daphnia pulex]|uniref:Uncharacterized protein n=1 Tax=Daphnia pulex TaxID=6669 RepID=E9HY97_DAPPU|nr:hypothetical protein DAPPUDRAFT_335671 [Daphnia pulex]|eukprot:EFX63285.1 hypothetical protein DAPPUDRAFT_335671 [Daphnia pulex]